MHPLSETEVLPAIARLHYLSQDDIPGHTHASLVRKACEGGAVWVQLRVKGRDEKDWEKIALEAKKIADEFGATLIINDNVQLAKKIGAAGVHLGKTDMPVEEARDILGENAIIGGTANNEEDLLRLMESNVNYIGLGPYRFTTTKKNLSPVLPFEELERMLSMQKTKPVILIGGIKAEDVEKIMAAGAHGIAVSSAINKAADISAAIGEFQTLLKRKNQ